MMKRKLAAIIILNILGTPIIALQAYNNGGYTDSGNLPQFGTHDWIALHALDFLPEEDTWWIKDHLDIYLLGTELPDNGGHPIGIGDKTLHHVYYYSSGNLQEDDAATRAQEEFEIVLQSLCNGYYSDAALHAGIMSHYISDLAVFGHVMGSGTSWGEETYHSHYEDRIETRTNEYPSDDFSIYLSFDGTLISRDAHNASLELAYDTTFDVDGDLTCTWMDDNYDWNDPIFVNRAGESLNLAANYLAEVIYTLNQNKEPLPKISSYKDIHEHNTVRMIYPSDNSSKPLGCVGASVSDWLASAFMTTKLNNFSEGMDIEPDWVDQDNGRPVGEPGTGIITFGGRFVNPIVSYVENHTTPQADRALIRFHQEGSTFTFQHANGETIPGAQLHQSVINDDQDLFLIETIQDSDGRFLTICYGFGWKGTYAAGKYFDSIIYPNLESFSHSWVIIKWEDTNEDGFVNNVGDGDIYTVIATEN